MGSELQNENIGEYSLQQRLSESIVDYLQPDRSLYQGESLCVLPSLLARVVVASGRLIEYVSNFSIFPQHFGLRTS